MLYGIHNNLARRFCCLVSTSFKMKEKKTNNIHNNGRGVGSEKENDHHRKSQQTMRKWYGKNVAFMVINGALCCQTNIHRTLDSYLLEFILHISKQNTPMNSLFLSFWLKDSTLFSFWAWIEFISNEFEHFVYLLYRISFFLFVYFAFASNLRRQEIVEKM